MFRLRWIAVGVIALYLAGFVLFVTGLPKAPGDLRHIQGIVALTGGEMRIDAAYRLFKRGVGKRLLISGVSPQVSRAAAGRVRKQQACGVVRRRQ